jgi:hypothetical protein
MPSAPTIARAGIARANPYHAVMTPLRAPDTAVIGADHLPEAMRNLGKVLRRRRQTPDISAESS